jgi:hypothetical protein
MQKLHKEANEELMNWARHVYDGWLESNLGVTPPPTSEGYVAPVVGFDEPTEPRHAVDEIRGDMTSDIVCAIGAEPGGIDVYRCLVRWYPNLCMRCGELGHAEMIKRLSKHMHCSHAGAERMLFDSVERYWVKRNCWKPVDKVL